MAKRYILVFTPEHPSFRLAELDSIAQLYNFVIGYDSEHIDLQRPCMLVELASEREARLLGSRSILIKFIIEYWGHGSNYDQLHDMVRASPSLYEPYVEDTSFKFTMMTINQSMPASEQIALFESFSYMGFKGPIKMKHADLELLIVEDHLAPKTPRPRTETFLAVYFGPKICDGQRHLIDVFDVKKRKYISNTTMEAEVSLLMANQALAAPGKLCYDPFTGSGSMLYVCAHFGAFVMGSDIDGRSMRGKRGKGIVDAAKQYGLKNRILDCMTFDLSNHPWRVEGCLDAIVTDCPYGIREGARKLGRKDVSKLRSEPVVMADGSLAHQLPDYVPPSRPWEMSEILCELLAFSYRMLKPGGRLVYWFPTVSAEFTPQDIPSHPGLRLISDSEQAFSQWSRHLVTMEKINHSLDPQLERGGLVQQDQAGSKKPAHYQFRERFFSGFGKRDVSS